MKRISMMSYIDIKDFIKQIKHNISNNIYKKAEELKDDIYKLNEYIWDEIEDISKSDLSKLYEVHGFLMDEVCKIHTQEEDDCNMELFKSDINIKRINSKLTDAKRAANMYAFNNCDYTYYLIGDLHSDTVSLKRILKQTSFFEKVIKGEKVRLIFLGDYVDRGKAHLKTLECILILKYIFSNNVFLLRGNHDGGTIKDGKVELCVRKPERECEEDYFLLYIYNLIKMNNTLCSDIIDKYIMFFESLCNIAFISHKEITILAVHGGIPRPRICDTGYYSYIANISDLTNEAIVDNLNRTIKHNMFWSDPCNEGEDLRESTGRFGFTIEHFSEFRERIGFDMLVRGHEAETDGYKKYFNDTLYTIFSSGRIMDKAENINNETVYTDISPKIVTLTKEGKISLVDLNKDYIFPV